MNRLLEFIGNNALLVTATIAMVLAAILFEIRVRARSMFELSPADAVKLINKGATVVDLRTPEQFKAGHIVESINMTEQALAKADEKRLKKKRPVLVVCENGSSSVKAAAALRTGGYEMSFALKGGLGAWQRDNMPLVGTSQPA